MKIVKNNPIEEQTQPPALPVSEETDETTTKATRHVTNEQPTLATAFKLTLAEFTPIQMLCIASIVSAIALTIICGVQGKLGQLSATFLSNPWYYLLLGLINPLAYYVILFKAYDLLPASQAQAINYSWAITLTLMAAVFLGQKIRAKDWLACGFRSLSEAFR